MDLSQVVTLLSLAVSLTTGVLHFLHKDAVAKKIELIQNQVTPLAKAAAESLKSPK